MFYNSNSQFPFPMPFMNCQMPQMFGVKPFPFPNPFQNNDAASQTAEQKSSSDCMEEEQKDPEKNNPFDFYQQIFQMFGQTPQMFGSMQQTPMMFEQMAQMLGILSRMFGQMSQNFEQMAQMFGDPTQKFSQMPQMFGPMPQMSQFMNLFQNINPLFAQGITNCTGANANAAPNASGLPFGIPVKLLQILLNLNSSPDGLSKFQKILDMIFDAYTKDSSADKNSL